MKYRSDYSKNKETMSKIDNRNQEQCGIKTVYRNQEKCKNQNQESINQSVINQLNQRYESENIE